MSPERMKILTGNDLITGDVTWWTGHDWSLHVDDAVPVGDDGIAIAASQEAVGRVVSGYVIDAVRDADGVRPAHIKDRIRALGPTVRLDLSLRPDDAAATGWIA